MSVSLAHLMGLSNKTYHGPLTQRPSKLPKVYFAMPLYDASGLKERNVVTGIGKEGAETLEILLGSPFEFVYNC
jgi:hypothetical protein